MMKKITKFMILSLLIFIVLPFGSIAGILLYSTKIEPNLLTVNDFTLGEDKGIKIAHFTDTQLGEFYDLADLEKVVSKVNKEKVDLILFTGDLIDHAASYEEKHDISKVLEKMEAKHGKFAVYGNHDYGGGASRFYEKIMKDSGFNVLVNDSVALDISGEKIRIFGGDDALLGKYHPKETMKGISPDETNILLLHEPDLADDFKDYPIDLIVAGHSHDGQVYIPFYGPIKKNNLAEIYSKGMYDLETEWDTKLYVNSGLGNTKVPFRMFNVPQIAVFNM